MFIQLYKLKLNCVIFIEHKHYVSEKDTKASVSALGTVLSNKHKCIEPEMMI